jgi:hypothetical protein
MNFEENGKRAFVRVAASESTRLIPSAESSRFAALHDNDNQSI